MDFTRLKTTTAKRRINRAFGVLFLLYLGVCGYFWSMQGQLIFKPMKELAHTAEQIATEKELEVKDITIPIRDSSKNKIGQLNAFWITDENPDAPVILHLHGQDATRAKHPEHLKQLSECGCHVLAIDYRGFAESFDSETTSEASVYEDALTALNYLKNDLDFPSNRIFIHGHSLGGAVAIELATRDESSGLAGLIVESSFTSIRKMSDLRYGGMLRILPVSSLLTEKLDSHSKISRVKIPVLFIHGECDDKVPHEMSEDLYEAAGKPKEICKIPGAGHDNCGSCNDPKYHDDLQNFITSCLDNPSTVTN